jgi:VanZ family protein
MALNGGVFSSVKNAWVAVIAYTLFLYSTPSLAYDTFMFLSRQVDTDAVSGWMNMLFLLAGLMLLLFVVFRLPWTWSGSLVFALIGFAVAMNLYALDLPAKRFHFFQYAPLTLLIFDALRFPLAGRRLYAGTLALVTLIGLGEETIQGILPTRYFGPLDIVVDAEAGLLTLLFIRFVVREENYGWVHKRNERPFLD